VLVCGGLQADGQLKPVLLQPPSSVQWSPVHPEPQDLATARAAQPLFFDPSLPAPLRVEVNAGEVLYLPAMWCDGFAVSLLPELVFMNRAQSEGRWVAEICW
jgi:hypothetical protein